MINKNPNLDREDGEQIRQSTFETWSALEFALGLNRLPRFERLYAPDEGGQVAVEAWVARDLVNLLLRTRGFVGANLQPKILADLTAERRRSTPATPPNSIPSSLEDLAASNAEAYLRVINRVIERRDIDNIINTLPARIRPTDGTRNWHVPVVNIGGANHDVTIDLTHPVWREGSEQQIRQRLENRTLAQAGILAVGLPSNHLLTAGDIIQLFGSSRDVIDPNLPIRQVVVENYPANGQRLIFDIPGMLRANPQWSTRSHALLLAQITALPANNNFIRIIDIATGGPVIPVLPAHVTHAVTQAFNQNSRSPLTPYASIKHSLTQAITARQPIDNLLRGAADNRELMLAFSALQRDPTAITAIQNTRLNDLLTARTRLVEERGLRSALDSLRTLTMPTRTVAAIDAAIVALVMGGGPNAATLYDRQRKVLEDERANNIRVSASVRQLLAAIRRTTSLPPALTAPGQPLQPYEAAVGGPGFEAVIIAPGNLDIGQMATTVERIFNNTPAINNDKSQILESTAHYDQELATNSEGIRIAQAERQPNGSEAAWLIVRREMENRGIRDGQLEKTLQYMRNQLDETPESARDIQELTNSVFPFEGDNEAPVGFWWGERNIGATKDWRKDKSFRCLSTLGLFKYKPSLRAYKNALFSERGGIGITLAQAELAASRSVPLPRLVDAYFRTAYLMELPETDPRRLPNDSVEMVTLMRKLHAAILDRSQLSFQNASGATEAELEQVGVRPGMKKIERLQAIQSYLLDGKGSYISENKDTIEKIINRAYDPIKTANDNHKYWKTGLWNRTKNIFTGEGHVANPLTYPARGVKWAWKFLNKKV